MGVGSSSIESANQPDATFVANPDPTTISPAYPTALSDFYVACRENRLEDVTRYLETASLADINRIEPHGSTALHAAAYYGHGQIVKLLLAKGALRTIRNSYKLTPCEEAEKPEIKKLFERKRSTKRFVGLSGSIEWNIIDPTAARTVSEYKETEKDWFTDRWADNSELYLKEIQRYARNKLTNIEGINQIYVFIDQAINETNVVPILKAYTAETGFYHALNIELASSNSVTYIEHDAEYQGEYFRYWHGPGGYAALIANHPAFEKYSFVGTSYRGMIMSDTDMNVYKANTFVINKAFLSTSTDSKIAKTFALPATTHNEDGGNTVKYPAICIYKIKNQRTAFNISDISEFPDEKEVLIMPRTAFRVASIKRKRSIDLQVMIWIKLHECAPENYIDTSSSIHSDDPYY